VRRLPITASGTARDKQDKSFVQSPSRGANYSAQEVFVGNSSTDALPVFVVNARGEVKADYNEISAGSLATVTIINKTISVSKEANLLKFSVSGDNVAIVTVLLNDQVFIKKRLTYTSFEIDYDLKSLIVTSGDNVKIIVENVKSELASFNATLFFSEYDL
jgi:hypothetical protein